EFGRLVVGADQCGVGHHDLDQRLAGGDRPDSCPAVPGPAVGSGRSGGTGRVVAGRGVTGRGHVLRLAGEVLGYVPRAVGVVVGIVVDGVDVGVGEEPAVEQGGQQVRAAGVHAARVVRAQPAGQPGQPGI